MNHRLPDRPAPRDGWMLIAAAALWCVTLGPPIYALAMWLMG